jgi:hypothetical protein
MYLMYQLNAHVQLNNCIVYCISATRFDPNCAILRDNSYHSSSITYCKVIAVGELQRVTTCNQPTYELFQAL